MNVGQRFPFHFEEFTPDIETRLIQYRENFFYLFVGKYLELLPHTVVYEYDKNYNSINFSKLEFALRFGNSYNVTSPYVGNAVVARNKKSEFVFCGFVNTLNTISEPSLIYVTERLSASDINFFLPRDEFPEIMTEIIDEDNCEVGNFVVVKNKTFSLTPDLANILHYAQELAELVMSRYSLVVQAKIMTFFTMEEGSESMTQVISKFFDGSPAIKHDALFDPASDIHTLDRTPLVETLAEIKRHYQNIVSELNTSVGINSLGVEKESGVSDLEAKGNSAYVTPIANTYLKPRQVAFNRLYRRYKNEIPDLQPVKVRYDDVVVSELVTHSKQESEVKHENGADDDNSKNNHQNRTGETGLLRAVE